MDFHIVYKADGLAACVLSLEKINGISLAERKAKLFVDLEAVCADLRSVTKLAKAADYLIELLESSLSPPAEL